MEFIRLFDSFSKLRRSHAESALEIAGQDGLGGEAHPVGNVREGEAFVGQQFGQFVGGIMLDPFGGRLAGNVFADFRKVFWRQVQFVGVPGHFPFTDAVFLHQHQEAKEMAGGDVLSLVLLNFLRIDVPKVIEEDAEHLADDFLFKQAHLCADSQAESAKVRFYQCSFCALQVEDRIVFDVHVGFGSPDLFRIIETKEVTGYQQQISIEIFRTGDLVKVRSHLPDQQIAFLDRVSFCA